ncbi:hypothetical protein MCUN1_002100 [Malassezia cuniculi]|uniref:Uncharacterized protein n=1 Tax=Malassezia cuniculi TaxID=948313 RepID=A0AAF0J733_9BASI|nr:hypothetical protein MCUN1_002100 [Malassezia cuniculi]
MTVLSAHSAVASRDRCASMRASNGVMRLSRVPRTRRALLSSCVAMEVCGMSTAAAAAGKKPIGSLECTSACRVAVRNARFADALGLAPKTAPKLPQFSNELVRYFATDRRAALAVQQSLCDFVQSPRASVSLRHQLQMHSVRTATEPVRVTQGLLAFASALARAFDLEAIPVENAGAMLSGLGARGADLDIRRTRTSRIPHPLPSETFAHPHADRLVAAAMRPQSPAPPKKVTKRPEYNAVLITGLQEPLAADVALLTAALENASLNGKRRWQTEYVPQGAVLHSIRLEPLSLAAVAGSAPPPELASLSSNERRLAAFASTVQQVLRTATEDNGLAAELAEVSPDMEMVRCQFAKASISDDAVAPTVAASAVSAAPATQAEPAEPAAPIASTEQETSD